MRHFSVNIPAALCVAAFSLGACSQGMPDTGFGPSPELPAPERTLIPTVNVAPAKSWAGNAVPVAAPGLAVSAFARDLDHPRWLYVLPNGDVLVAETNRPPSQEKKGFMDWVQGLFMKRGGAITESANRITLLRDADGDGVPELRSVFLKGLYSPFGMVLVGDNFYVANADAVLRFPYVAGETSISVAGVKVADLPAGINHHWTKNLVASADGTKLYVSIGSNSNAAENGMEMEKNRAAILEIDLASGEQRLFASGLRNPVGMAWEPVSGKLWTSVNERDELGNDLVPDYMTSVQDGAFYGWPYSYYGQHVDPRIRPQNPDMVAKAIAPDYALGAHTASLGLSFAEGSKLPAPFTEGAFVGQHGSWNRKPYAGYKVIFVPFANGMPNGTPRDVLTGFLNDKGEAQGRPVGVAIDHTGALLVADDVGNVIWRVSAAAAPVAQ